VYNSFQHLKYLHSYRVWNSSRSTIHSWSRAALRMPEIWTHSARMRTVSSRVTTVPLSDLPQSTHIRRQNVPCLPGRKKPFKSTGSLTDFPYWMPEEFVQNNPKTENQPNISTLHCPQANDAVTQGTALLNRRNASTPPKTRLSASSEVSVQAEDLPAATWHKTPKEPGAQCHKRT
jgi:hypothetical protein